MENVEIGDENQVAVKTDIKRSFRLRPVDTTGRISKKYGYLKSPCIRSIAWLQLLIGIITIMVQIVMFCTSKRLFQDDLAGAGIPVGMLQILSSILTLMAVADPAYFWLHMSMSFNIITAVAFYLLGAYACYYPLQYFNELQEESCNSPYTSEELKMLNNCAYTILYVSMVAIPISAFVSICCGLPVFCGQKEMMPFGKRKSSDGQGQLKSSAELFKSVKQHC